MTPRSSTPPLDEKALDHLEEQFPRLFRAAVTHAYWATLAQGLSVLERTEAGLVETFPDGSSKFIKPLEPWVRVTPGEKRVLR